VEEHTGGSSSRWLNKCSCGYGRGIIQLENPERHTIRDSPGDALISEPKVKFPKMAHRILLVLPPHPLTDCAKAALKPIVGHLEKSIICQTRLEASSKVHTLNLGELQTTKETSQGYSALESSGDPLAGRLRTTTQPAQHFQLDRIRLVLSRWSPSGPVMDFPDRPLPSANNMGLVACDSARLCLPALDLICVRREGHGGLLGLNIGNQRGFKGACLNIPSSSGGLMETNQKSLRRIHKYEDSCTT